MALGDLHRGVILLPTHLGSLSNVHLVPNNNLFANMLLSIYRKDWLYLEWYEDIITRPQEANKE